MDKELLDEIIKLTYPDWAKSDSEQLKFRSYVLEKHILLERTINVLIVAYFFDHNQSNKASEFHDNILDKLDFCNKVKFLKDGCIVEDKSIISAIYKTNDFRVAWAHIKKGNSDLRDPKKLSEFQKVSTNATAGLFSKLMLYDSNLKNLVMSIIKKDGLDPGSINLDVTKGS